MCYEATLCTHGPEDENGMADGGKQEVEWLSPHRKVAVVLAKGIQGLKLLQVEGDHAEDKTVGEWDQARDCKDPEEHKLGPCDRVNA
jgi:hypothetical protein